MVKDDDSTVEGCHESEAEALEQVEALYAQEPELAADTGADPHAGMDEVPAYGVLVVEGVETGDTPRREFAPGSLTWADPPLSFKWQPAEDEGHSGSVVVGRMDQIWRDGPMIRWIGAMDNVGVAGREAIRLRQGNFVRGTSIMADDTDNEDVELIYPESADAADGDEMLMPEPSKVLFHAARIRSSTLLPEPAFVEATLELGQSPFQPTLVEDELEDEPAEAVTTVTAASYTVTIPEVWPEWWFQEPREQPPFGALHITPQGRVFGYLGPAKVPHRAFRASGRTVTIPRGVDYSEFQNKPCLVAGADGNVYQIPAGNVTFDCGHPSPHDARRQDPSWAMQHYDNSCSVAARVRVGENTYGTWVAGGLLHGITPDAFERMMACALSGDWQGGKLNAALLVPVEGFPIAASARLRVRDDVLVASTIPIVYDAPSPVADTRATLERIARGIGRDAAARFAQLRVKAGR